MGFQPARLLAILLIAVGASCLVTTKTTLAGTVDGDPLTPVDPVVEEPIRPLLPGGEIITSPSAARCGTLAGPMFPAGLALLGALRFASPRRR